MPRRSFLLILVAAFIALVCHARADRQPYGQYFSEILGIVERNFVEPVDEKQLFESAVNGLIEKLDDDHTRFLKAEDSAELRRELDQEFGGIGVEVMPDPKTKELTVISPLIDSPAYNAGIRPGDKIVSVNGKSIKGLPQRESVALICGKIGETVKLQIARNGVAGLIDIEVVRQRISIDSVRGDRRRADGTWDFVLAGHPRIGYIRISTFGEHTFDELSQALDQLHQAGIQALVIDLRNNSGGLLNTAVDICELFVPPGKIIVTTRGRDGKIDEEEFKSSSSGGRFHWPMCVLINRDSASASEILAACLQDNGCATIVGERSFGKGSVQKIHQVAGGTASLKLTESSYWRPNKKNIHRRKTSKETDDWGVRPDPGFDIKLSDEEMIAWHDRRRKRDVLPSAAPPLDQPQAEDDNERDPQLAKAIDYLSKKLPQKAQLPKP